MGPKARGGAKQIGAQDRISPHLPPLSGPPVEGETLLLHVPQKVCVTRSAGLGGSRYSAKAGSSA